MTIPQNEGEPEEPVGPLDLNLIATFDAVMVERNLRRAAERLGRSQPAVSQAVARLRDLIGDRLFERVPTGVEPTPRAEALWNEVRDPLRAIGRALDHRDFDPSAARGELVLALADDVHELCFAALARRMRAAAPGLALRAIETDHRAVWDQVGAGLADIAVTVAPPPPRGLGAVVLGEQRFVLIHRSDQSPPATLDAYLRAPHVAIGFADRSLGYTDERLAGMGQERRIIVTTPRFAAIPELVRQTGALATMPEPIARHYVMEWSQVGNTSEINLSIAPIPFELQPVVVRMGWHQRRRTDPLNEWARGIFEAVVAKRMFEQCAGSRC